MSEPNKEAIALCQKLCDIRTHQMEIFRMLMTTTRTPDEMVQTANLIAQDAELGNALKRLRAKFGDDSE